MKYMEKGIMNLPRDRLLAYDPISHLPTSSQEMTFSVHTPLKKRAKERIDRDGARVEPDVNEYRRERTVSSKQVGNVSGRARGQVSKNRVKQSGPRPRSDESKVNEAPTIDLSRARSSARQKRRLSGESADSKELALSEPPLKKQRLQSSSARDLSNSQKGKSRRLAVHKNLNVGVTKRVDDDDDVVYVGVSKRGGNKVSSVREAGKTKGVLKTLARAIRQAPSRGENQTELEEATAVGGDIEAVNSDGVSKFFVERENVEQAEDEEEELEEEQEEEDEEDEEPDAFIVKGIKVNANGEVENDWERNLGEDAIDEIKEVEQTENENAGGHFTTPPINKKSRNEDPEFFYSPATEKAFEEGVERLEENSDFESDNDPLLAVYREQQKRKIAGERREVGLASPVRREEEVQHPNECHNIQENWIHQFESRPKIFYFGDEASLKKPIERVMTSAGKTRATPYKGVNLTAKNSFDMLYAYENYYRALRNCRGQESERYNQFKLTVGQLARAALSFGRLQPETMWKKGKLFRLVANKVLFMTFLEHFQDGGSYGSVNNKAIHLSKFVSIARSYLISYPMYESQQKNKKLMTKIDNLIRFLQQRSSVNKKLHRQLKSESKELDYLAETAKLITPEDWDMFRVKARSHLDGIQETLQRIFSSDSSLDMTHKRSSANSWFEGNEAVLRKWCMNFLVYLVMMGCGQRNQVYCLLRVPEYGDLLDGSDDDGEGETLTPLKLKLVPNSVEKRPRNIKFPYVLFPKRIAHYIRFHIDFVRPILVRRLKARGGIDKEYLLLNSTTGKPLTSKSVRTTVTQWVKTVSPELHVTPMDIRRSYCTFTIRRFIENEEQEHDNIGDCWFAKMKPETFIEMVAEVMNTSVEQVTKVYSACKHGDSTDIVGRVLQIV